MVLTKSTLLLEQPAPGGAFVATVSINMCGQGVSASVRIDPLGAAHR